MENPRNLLGHPSRKHLVLVPTSSSPSPDPPVVTNARYSFLKNGASVFSSSPSLSLSLSEFSFFFDLALDEKSDDSFNLLFFFEEDLSFEFWKRNPFPPLLLTFSPLSPGSSSSPKVFLRFLLLFQRDFRFPPFLPLFGGFPLDFSLPSPPQKANLGEEKEGGKGVLPLNFHSQERPESERVKLLPNEKRKRKKGSPPFHHLPSLCAKREKKFFPIFGGEEDFFPLKRMGGFLDLLFP